MKKLSKNKQLNDVLQLQQFLLYEASGGKLGVKSDVSSDIPFVERLKFLTALQNSALIANKVEPLSNKSGLADLRDMLKDDEEKGEVPSVVNNGEMSDDDTAPISSRGKPSRNGSTALISDRAEESDPFFPADTKIN